MRQGTLSIKHWFSLTAACLAVAGLAACGGGTPTPAPTQTPPSPAASATPAPTPSVMPSATASGVGVVEGRFSIGPLCPVEPCQGEPANPYVGRSAVLTPSSGGTPAKAPLADDGTFRATAPAGAYELTLEDCPFMGCGHALPEQVVVLAGQVTTIEVDIDTGIR